MATSSSWSATGSAIDLRVRDGARGADRARDRDGPGRGRAIRRALILGGAGALVLPRRALGQTGRTYRLGLLDYSAREPVRLEWWDAFVHRLRELEYVEGRNVVFERRWADGRADVAPALAAQLVEARVEIIVTAGAVAALAAKQVTSTVPVVMATGPDPVALGLVESLARPGGNITGVTSISSELSGKRLELARELVPGLARVGVLWDENNPAARLSVGETQARAEALGLSLHPVGVRDIGAVPDAFRALSRERAGAVIVLMSPMFFPHRHRLADLALQHRLPAVVVARPYAEAGGLVAYGTSFPDLFRRAAEYVDRILRGARPGDLPIEQPRRFELIVNLRTARALGVTVPPSLLLRADHVIH